MTVSGFPHRWNEYTLNNRGPEIVPCGTLMVQAPADDNSLFIQTQMVQSVYHLIHLGVIIDYLYLDYLVQSSG